MKNSGGMRTGTQGSKGYPSSEGGKSAARPTLRTYREGISSATGNSPSAKPTHNMGRNTMEAGTKKK